MDNSVERDKRIEEIRKTLKIAMVNAHGKTSEHFRTWSDEYFDDVTYLLEEIERLQTALHTHQSCDKSAAELYVEVSQLREERDALIKALKWYADKDKHEIKRRIGGDYAPIVLDKGENARKALRALGIGEEHENPSKP